MTYGLRFTNDNDVVVLDSEYSRLVVIHQGVYGPGGVGFPAPVNSAEPPLVFVRPDASTTFQYVAIVGTPGNYTGFSMIGGGSGKYFCAAFKSVEMASYGMRLRDESDKLIFDSGTPCAQFTRAINSWSYIGFSHNSQGQTIVNFTAPSDLTSGDYLMLNNIGMDVAANTGRSAKLYCSWSYESNRIVMFTIGVTNVTSFFIPTVFAKQI